MIFRERLRLWHRGHSAAVLARARTNKQICCAAGSSGRWGPLDNLPQLDPQPGEMDRAGYAVFGHVVAGMDVVDKIAAVPRGGVGPMPGAAPLTPIVIEKVKVVE